MDIEALERKAKEELARLPRRVVVGDVSNRRGIQHLALARIAKAAWDLDDGLLVVPEYRTEYSWNGDSIVGYLDLCIFEGDYHTLAVAVEIVTDHVTDDDLYKLRDAPVAEGGGRWVVQLNPYIRHPINRSQALDETMSDDDMERLLVIEVWRREYTGLHRRQWASRAEVSQRRRLDDCRVWPGNGKRLTIEDVE